MSKELENINTSKKKILEGLIPLLSVMVALLVGGLILLVAKKNPVDAYAALFTGAFGSFDSCGDTLIRATPVIFTGLAIAFAFKCGLFNIGAEGQLLLGGLASALVGHYVTGLPMIVHLTIAVLSAALAGGIWALIPGILKAFKGVHEVITTIMLNYIAVSLTAYFIEILRQGSVPETPVIQDTAKIFPLTDIFSFFESSRFNISFFAAITAACIISFLLYRTVLGYEIRAVGFSPLAAENSGIKVGKSIIYAMFISGMLAGLGGASEVLGIHYSFKSGLSPGYGFEGIAVSLLANNNPIAIVFSGILFGALSNGGFNMDMSADVPQDIVIVIQALIIFFVATNQLVKSAMKRFYKKGVKA